MPRAVVGIVGGLGPLAGADFYRRLVRATPARNDHEHLEVVLISDPSIPSRSEHLLGGGGESPVAALAAVIDRLIAAGATLVAIPSTTTHAYHSELAARTSVPIVDLRSAVGRALADAGLRAPGVIATTAAARLRVLDPGAPGVELRYPDDAAQRVIQEVIDAVKGGGPIEEARATISGVLRRPCFATVDGFVFACTETALLLPLPLEDAPGPMVSASDALIAEILTRL